MKMNTLFLFDPQRLKKQIHQECLATTNSAPDVEAWIAFSIRLICTTKQLQPPAPRSVGMQALLQLVEMCDDFLLRRIPLMAFTMEAFLVGLANSQNTGYPFLRRSEC